MDYLNKNRCFLFLENMLFIILMISILLFTTRTVAQDEERSSDSDIKQESDSQSYNNLSNRDEELSRMPTSTATSTTTPTQKNSVDDSKASIQKSQGSSKEEDLRSPDAISNSSNNTTSSKLVLLPPGVEEKTYEGVSRVEGASLARKKNYRRSHFKNFRRTGSVYHWRKSI